MKKKLFFTALFFAILCFAYSHSANYVSKCSERGKIDLHGKLNQGGPKSIAVPLEAFINPSSLDVVFLQHLSNLSIEIVDEFENRVYYEKNLSPYSGQQLEISIIGWDEGRYTIIFSDSSGGYMYGRFEI